MTRLVVVALCTGVIAMAAPGVARAVPIISAESPSASDALDRVRGEYEAGIASYKRGRYADAIEQFKGAYAMSLSPSLLFNIAQSYRHLGDLPAALTAYRGYLQQQPDAPNRAEVESRIVELERAMTWPTGLVVESSPSALAPAPAVDRGARRHRWTIASVAALGAVGALSLTSAGALSMRAAGQADDLGGVMAGTAWTPSQADQYAEGQRLTDASYALYVVGGTAIAASVVIAVMNRRAFGPERVARPTATAAKEMVWRF